MKLLLKSVFIIISIVLTLLICELLLQLTSSANPVEHYQELTESLPSDSENPKYFVARKYQPKRPHPYLGFVYNDSLIEGINADGFRESKELPYAKDKNEFVIGVFGGSFASDFAETQVFKESSNEIDFEQRLKQLAPDFFKDKKITVLNFGLASGRQPQQYFAISLYLDFLDMALIIDGFNEAYRNRDLDFPIYYPDYSKFFFSKRSEDHIHWANLLQMRERQQSFTKSLLNRSLLKNSKVIYHFWRAYKNYLDLSINKIAQAERPTMEFPQNISREDYNHQKAQIWSKYTRLQAQLLKNENIPFVHVLQPNQHLPGSKIFTDEEKERFMWKMNPNLESMQATYQMIISEQQKFKNSGLPIFDYTQIFKDQTDTLYRDKCCHINKAGINLLEEALATDVVKVLIQKTKK